MRLSPLLALAALCACATTNRARDLHHQLAKDVGWATKAQLVDEWGAASCAVRGDGYETCVWVLSESMVLDKPRSPERGEKRHQHTYTKVSASFKKSKLHAYQIDARDQKGRESSFESPGWR